MCGSRRDLKVLMPGEEGRELASLIRGKAQILLRSARRSLAPCTRFTHAHHFKTQQPSFILAPHLHQHTFPPPSHLAFVFVVTMLTQAPRCLCSCLHLPNRQLAHAVADGVGRILIRVPTARTLPRRCRGPQIPPGTPDPEDTLTPGPNAQPCPKVIPAFTLHVTPVATNSDR